MKVAALFMALVLFAATAAYLGVVVRQRNHAMEGWAEAQAFVRSARAQTSRAIAQTEEAVALVDRALLACPAEGGEE